MRGRVGLQARSQPFAARAAFHNTTPPQGLGGVYSRCFIGDMIRPGTKTRFTLRRLALAKFNGERSGADTMAMWAIALTVGS